jgi:parallel beta-helix repeat protein
MNMKKIVLLAFVSLFILATVGTQFMVRVAATPMTIYVDVGNASGPWDGTAEHPYKNITSGIEYASAGDTIYVRAGTYNESIFINKNNLMLVGENREATVINGGGASSVIYVAANNVTFSGFTIKNSGKGIWLWNSNNNNFSDNAALNNQYGIYINGSSHNILSGNTVSNNTYGIYASDSDSNVLSGNIASYNQYAVYLDFSRNNVLSSNTASSNNYGFYLWGSDNNLLSGNSISSNVYGIYFFYSSNNTLTYNDASNSQHGFYLWQSKDNIISQNNFINNTEQVSSIGSVNSWDNGVEGNYWSDYHGVDANRDGIGDTPYVIDANNTDRYPLMGIFNIYPVPVPLHVPSNVTVISNSTITDFLTPISLDTPYPEVMSVSFNVTGKQGSTGFCRVSIQTAVMNGTFQVFVNGTEIPYTLLPCSNANVSYLYFTYKQSTEQVEILPEFSSAIILPLFMALSMLAVIFIKRRLLKTPIH